MTLLLYKDGPAIIKGFDEDNNYDNEGLWSLSGSNLQISGISFGFESETFVVESYSDEEMVLKNVQKTPSEYWVYDENGKPLYTVDYTFVHDVRWTLRKTNVTSNSRRAMQRAR